MPRYETADDRRRARDLADHLEHAWNCAMEEQPPGAAVDFIGYADGDAVVVAEVKCKQGVSTRVSKSHFYVDCDKVRALHDYSTRYNCVGFFVVQFDDGVWFIDYEDAAQCEVVIAGRRDRADPHDQDAAYLVPREWAHPLPKRATV